MKEENKNKEEQQEEKTESYLVIKFDSPGSAIFSLESDNVSPVQMLALSQYLEWFGKVQLQSQYLESVQRKMEKQSREGIAIPGQHKL